MYIRLVGLEACIELVAMQLLEATSLAVSPSGEGSKPKADSSGTLVGRSHSSAFCAVKSSLMGHIRSKGPISYGLRVPELLFCSRSSTFERLCVPKIASCFLLFP